MKRIIMILLILLLPTLILVSCDDTAPDPASSSEQSKPSSSSGITHNSSVTSQSDKQDSGADQSQDNKYPSAYNFKMQDLNGNEIQLSSLAGKPIVLNFWASWCPPCKAEMPELESAYKKCGDQINFVMVSVDDTLSDAKGFYEGSPYTFPVYFDNSGMGSYLYSISSIPQTFFINSQGKIISSHVGAITGEQLENAINILN